MITYNVGDKYRQKYILSASCEIIKISKSHVWLYDTYYNKIVKVERDYFENNFKEKE